MDIVAVYFNGGAMLTVVACLIVAVFLHWKTAPKSRRLLAMGSFTQSASWLISLISSVFLLANLSDPSEIGPALAFIIMTALYGTAVHVFMNVFSVFFSGESNLSAHDRQ